MLRCIEDENSRRQSIAQQKQEAANSYISYNDGAWSGKATIIDVDMLLEGRDIVGASPITSQAYTITGETEIGVDGINQFNTLQWETVEDGGVSFSRYTSALSSQTGGFDVDSVDGSYSTDHTLLDLNLPGKDKNVVGTFAIETSVAVEDDRRLRSMLIYGFARKLNRVVLFDEVREKGEGGVEGMSVQERVLREVEGMDDPSDRMKEIQRAAMMGAAKAKSEAKEEVEREGGGRVVVETFAPPLRRVCGGTWEGDGVLRNNDVEANNKGSKKKLGFGLGSGRKDKRTGAGAGAGINDGFAEWSVNVFKSNLTFQWDGQRQLRSSASIGVGLGATTDYDSQPLVMVSWGDLVVEGRLDVGKGVGWKDKESVNVGVWDDGEAVSLQLGCCMVKAGLNLKGGGEEEENGSVAPFSSEMSVFQRREVGEGETEYFLSKLGRLYGKQGVLKSGSSGFYKLKPFFVDE
ncbi:hypothetical protein TrCOL_g129 [Triparma columacea]|uniref:Uncharacterized protein n=1 Tax=Triparma columacea TaxID=722753 RepID=A0A9W7GDM3_9STRA|nr:hypothetical protein TrCOL_g129 [Triparma columacea]